MNDMATKSPDTQTRLERYADCIITPMSTNGDPDPLVRVQHLVDAVIVGCIVLFAVVLGDVAFALWNGSPAYLSPGEIARRLPTALVAFFLTFFAQWGRARGLDVLAALERFRNNNN